jgi:antitoxin HigA-1
MAEASLTSDIAARLSLALGNTARFWLNLQANYDAWHVERDSRTLIARMREVAISGDR